MTLKTDRSKQLFAEAQELLPGGVDSPVRAWRSVGGDPLFISHGAGDKIFDVDGNEFVDYVCSWGPLILGHAHPEVVKAIQGAASRGTSYGAPVEGEIELARRIVDAVPSLEMVRFVSSGTEATMSAIRLARAYTRRDKILKFGGGYHGHADLLLAKAGSGVTTYSLPDSAGVPKAIAAPTLTAPYNDLAAVEKVIADNKDEIAAVIVEPVAGNMGVVIPAQGFLEGLRDLTSKNGVLLIFDEVISGFRVGWGGAQKLYGVTPDLTCLGKIVGGGLPVGAYGGRRDIMNMVAPLGPVYQAGTLSGNPLAMAAGIATLDVIVAQKDAYGRLEKLGAQLQKGLADGARSAGVPVTVNRVGSMMTAFFTDCAVVDYDSAKTSSTERYARFFNGMLERGFYFAPSQFEATFVSLAHTEEDIARTVKAAGRVLQELK